MTSYYRQTSGISLRPLHLHHPFHHVRTNALKSPRRSQDCSSAKRAHLYFTRRRDARPNRTYPHTHTHFNPTCIHNSCPTRLSLPYVANPYTNPTSTALALSVSSTTLRSPKPLHPCGSKPMDAIQHADLTLFSTHIHVNPQNILAR